MAPKKNTRRPGISTASRRPRRSTGKNPHTIIPEDTMPQEPEAVARHTAPEHTGLATATALLAALRGIEESMHRIAEAMEKHAARPACGSDKPLKVGIDSTMKPEGGSHAKTPGVACEGCGSVASIHKSDCPVKYPKAAPAKAKKEPEAPPVPSYDEVRAAAVKYAQARGKPALIEALRQYTEGGLTEVPEEMRADFIASLTVEE